MVYVRKDVEDNSETIVKEGQTVTNNDYHKVYDALKALPSVKNVTFSSKEEQYQKLTETMGDEWKVFEGDANPLHDAFHSSPIVSVSFWYCSSLLEKVTFLTADKAFRAL